MSGPEGQEPQSSLTAFVLALLRVMVTSGQYGTAHPHVAKSIEQAYTVFRLAVGPGTAVVLRSRGSDVGTGFLVGRVPGPEFDVAEGLPATSRDRLMQHLIGTCSRAGMDTLAILHAIDEEEFKQGLVLVADTAQREADPMALLRRSLDAGVYRMLALGESRFGIGRELDRTTKQVLHTLQTVARFSHESAAALAENGRKPNDLLRDMAVWAMAGAQEHRRARRILTSADLAVKGLPAGPRKALIEHLVESLPMEWMAPVVTECDEVVRTSGGPASLKGRLDDGGVPLLGYLVVARAIRVRAERAGITLEEHQPEAEGEDEDSGWGSIVFDAPETRAYGTPSADTEPNLPIHATPRIDLYGVDTGTVPPAARPVAPADPTAIEIAAEPAYATIELGLGVPTASGPMPAPSDDGPMPVDNVTRRLVAEAPAPPTKPGHSSHLAGIEMLVPPAPDDDDMGDPADVAAAPPPLPDDAATVSGSRRTATGVARLAPSPSAAATARRRPTLDPRVDQWVREFDELCPLLIERARNPPSTKHYEGALKILSHAASVMIERGQYPDVIAVLRLIKLQERQAPMWPHDKRAALTAAKQLVLDEDRVDELVERYPAAALHAREALYEILSAYGRRVVPGMARLLVDRAGDVSIRKEILAVVEGIGLTAGPALVEAVTAYRRRWNRVLPLIRLVGAVRYRQAEPVIADFLKHPKPSVRADTIISLYNMLGRDAQSYLLDALTDPHPDVRQKAIALLAVSGCKEAPFIALLGELLTGDAVDDGLREGLVIGAVLALQDLGNIELSDAGEAELVLATLLRESVSGGMFSLVNRSQKSRSTGLLSAICETLGAIGGRRARQVLQQAMKSGAPVIKESALLALERVEARLT